ncbi:MAG: DUF5009 domain-containing protein [Chlamydiae bacterium]|nr:MAG: DUF5009 domain-containing protein [Chlamydiota bacterium]
MKLITEIKTVKNMKTMEQEKIKERLYSLDTLRGFDMFWIIGGGLLLQTLANFTNWHWLNVLAEQTHHVKWSGFHFNDLIFPLFMFISGVAIPYALISKIEKGESKITLFKKIFRRMILLIIFGFIYNGMLKNGFHNLRFASVLAQIGIAYFFAALIAINTKSLKSRLLWIVGILAFIAFAQFFVKIGEYGGNFIPDKSINAWVDQHFLFGKLYDKTFDPEGLLCIISAVSVTLMGTIAGTVLRNKEYNQSRKTVILFVMGTVLILLALSLSPVYPIIKKMWTVPFDLLAAGISVSLLAIFYFIIDVKKKRNWIFFFQVIGMNSITIYLGRKIIDFGHPARFLMGWTVPAFGDISNIILIITSLALEWLLLYYFYKKKIFLKV